MKLAICSAGELFGGVERHILGMSTWLRREGHEFVLILFHDRELARQAREIGVEPVILETRGSFDLRGPGRLARILKEHQVDVVHAHGYRAVVNCALAQRRYPFAMVRTVHGLVESGAVKGKLFAFMESYFGRHSSASVIYVTNDLRRRLSEKDSGLVTKTIYNGIEPLNRTDYERPDDLDPGVFNFAAVGRVSKVKGLEYAIRAMSLLPQNPGAVFNIIGTGPMVKDLVAMTESLGICDRVKFLGFKENIFHYLAHIDTLVMPSIHEGLPYTILEAMSLGIPIIASQVGGLEEVLEDGRTAYLVSPGDPQGLGEVFLKILESREQNSVIGFAAREQQIDSFGLDDFGRNYWRHYSMHQSKAGSDAQF